jgi:hypothetical protein
VVSDVRADVEAEVFRPDELSVEAQQARVAPAAAERVVRGARGRVQPEALECRDGAPVHHAGW